MYTPSQTTIKLIGRLGKDRASGPSPSLGAVTETTRDDKSVAGKRSGGRGPVSRTSRDVGCLGGVGQWGSLRSRELGH
eukprot:3953996-Pyramimonas_sp.AAC.1